MPAGADFLTNHGLRFRPDSYLRIFPGREVCQAYAHFEWSQYVIQVAPGSHAADSLLYAAYMGEAYSSKSVRIQVLKQWYDAAIAIRQARRQLAPADSTVPHAGLITEAFDTIKIDAQPITPRQQLIIGYAASLMHAQLRPLE